MLLSVFLAASCGGATDSEPNYEDVDRPVFSEDGKMLTYGFYPQSVVYDPALTSALDAVPYPVHDDWYLLNGEYFYRYSPVGGGSFCDGTTMLKNGFLLV